MEILAVSDILVGQTHTKFENGALIDQRTRQAIARHLASFAAIVKARAS